VAALLTLQEAKTHLRVTIEDDNEDIVAKMNQASDLVLKHVNTAAVPGWSNGTVPIPGNVKAATCLVLTYLYEHRGDAMEPSADIWQAVDRVLVATRASALA
jgi:hypothetical protein